MILPEFHEPDNPIGDVGTVGEFWRWAMSDLLGNRNRGILAEFLIAKALGEKTLQHPRIEWDCYDLIYRGHWIEVKSSAYIQSWHDDPNTRSRIEFNISAAKCWDARSNTYSQEKKRHAHIYIFCIFPADRKTYKHDVHKVDQWAFFVTTTANLETHIREDQEKAGITTIRKICGDPIPYKQLKSRIDDLLDTLS